MTEVVENAKTALFKNDLEIVFQFSTQQTLQAKLGDSKFGNYEIGSGELRIAELLGRYSGYFELPIKKGGVKTGELQIRCFRTDPEINYIEFQFAASKLTNFGIMSKMLTLYKIFKPNLSIADQKAYKLNKIDKNTFNDEDWKQTMSHYIGKTEKSVTFPPFILGADALCFGIWELDLKVELLAKKSLRYIIAKTKSNIMVNSKEGFSSTSKKLWEESLILSLRTMKRSALLASSTSGKCPLCITTDG